MNIDQILISFYELEEKRFKAIFNAHGSYTTGQFVLRLSYQNHDIMETFINGKEYLNPESVTSEALTTYSTYIHENIHWWQHIGSTSGLILTLCNSLITNGNIKHLRKMVTNKQLLKPIEKISTHMSLHCSDQSKFYDSHIVTNNTHDIENFKKLLLGPTSAKMVSPLFESKGHSYEMTYSLFTTLISETLQTENKSIHWEPMFRELKKKKVTGFYYGGPNPMARVGIREIFEGQACFSQMQFLAHVGEIKYDSLSELLHKKIIHGVYRKAFDIFLENTKQEVPSSVTDPIVDLFLLVCDMSMNPGEGFPFDIKHPKDFIYDADPGIRFETICYKIKDNIEELTPYSRDDNEYWRISDLISKKCNYISPKKLLSEIHSWPNKIIKSKSLLEKYQKMDFGNSDIIVELTIAKFIEFSIDKKSNPSFFCWPGYHKAHSGTQIKKLWLKHIALFQDKKDDDEVFMRDLGNVPKERLQKTVTSFFTSQIFYEIIRQWILDDGDFSFDFRWIKNEEKFFYEEICNEIFEKKFGINTNVINHI